MVREMKELNEVRAGDRRRRRHEGDSERSRRLWEGTDGEGYGKLNEVEAGDRRRRGREGDSERSRQRWEGTNSERDSKRPHW
jgi:hypothetical protein